MEIHRRVRQAVREGNGALRGAALQPTFQVQFNSFCKLLSIPSTFPLFSSFLLQLLATYLPLSYPIRLSNIRHPSDYFCRLPFLHQSSTCSFPFVYLLSCPPSQICLDWKSHKNLPLFTFCTTTTQTLLTQRFFFSSSYCIY